MPLKQALPKYLLAAGARLDRAARAARTRLTIGGEPTYIPFLPDGPEWSVAALGPSKLPYAYRFAHQLATADLPGALAILSPGKSYPGELSPRWILNLLLPKRRTRFPCADPAALAPPDPRTSQTLTPSALRQVRNTLARSLGVAGRWMTARDPLDPRARAWVLPLDHSPDAGWTSPRWFHPPRRTIELLNAAGAAGLRLPLHTILPGASRRALALEIRDHTLHAFIPPLLPNPFLELLGAIETASRPLGITPRIEGYPPAGSEPRWRSLAIAPDPGVLEVNLPPEPSWTAYARWIETLDRCAARAGLCTYKLVAPGESESTGGGNHILFGAAPGRPNPLFQNPRWIAAILRYWQAHPSLAYAFTGRYVGPASQAPRPDESGHPAIDLELAYRFLESLAGPCKRSEKQTNRIRNHQQLVGETLRHLHADSGGNNHRCEISFDKFWCPQSPGGCRGLIEFRALETLPRTDWTAAVALLWWSLFVMLSNCPRPRPLRDFSASLHDRFMLPFFLAADIESILQDLDRARLNLPRAPFAEILDWRFPRILDFARGTEWVQARRAHQPWPLLSETPEEGGTTSRFVDASLERLEFTASASFAANWLVAVNGRRLPLAPFAPGLRGAGLKYRRTKLHPSLHPGIAPQLPLRVELVRRTGETRAFQLPADRRHFEPATPPSPGRNPPPALRSTPDAPLTFDLRLR